MRDPQSSNPSGDALAAEPYERYPALAAWIETIAHTANGPLSARDWDNFIEAINRALRTAEQNGKRLKKPREPWRPTGLHPKRGIIYRLVDGGPIEAARYRGENGVGRGVRADFTSDRSPRGAGAGASGARTGR